MSNHVIIRVGATHHGALMPGLLIVLPIEKVRPANGRDLFERSEGVSFENPMGGFSFGEAVWFLDLPT